MKSNSTNYNIRHSELYPEPNDSLDENIFVEDEDDEESEDESNDIYGLKDLELR